MAREHDADFQGAYFAFDIAGITLGYFTGCSGLSVEFDVIDFKQTDGTKLIQRKRPGRPKYSEVVLKRGLTSDKALHDWFKQIVDAKDKTPYKTASIIVYDRQMAESARFNLEQCWPSKLSASDLDAGSDATMVEELTIQHEFIDWVK